MSKLLIIGSGERDEMPEGQYDIMAINKEIGTYKNARYHISVHARILTTDSKYITHCCEKGLNVDCLWKFKNNGGTSGLFALHVAQRLGYNSIAFYGVPLSGTYGSFAVKQQWLKYRNSNDCSNVRSFGGLTLKWFGDARGWF